MKVVVIGGGIMGLACAWRLAGAGADVMLLESRNVGEGATLAALGALWPASPLSRGPLQELHRESLGGFEEFAREVSEAAGLPVSFRRLGRVELLNSKKAEIRAIEESAYAQAHWPAFGRPAMEVLSVDMVQNAYPWIEGRGEAALVCRATAQVRVAELVAGLHAACDRAGVAIHEHRKVTALEKAERRILGARCDDVVFAADAFLLAGGAWMGLLPGAEQVAPIRPVKGQGLALSVPAGLKIESIVKCGPIYLIPWDHEILVGATTEPEAGFDELVTDSARQMLFDGACEIVPALRESRILRQWAGLRPQVTAKPHDPVMGFHPGLENCFVCAGHFKTGIGMAPLVSELVRQSILTGKLDSRLLPFAPTY